MPKPKKDIFIHELPLAVNPNQDRVLMVRLNAARQLYNACLSESLRRLDLMCESKLWRRACRSRDDKERASLFRQVRKQYGFSDYAIQAFAVRTKNACWIGEHLDTHTCQKMGTRAFETVAQYAYGKRGRPRFRNYFRFKSIEGKSNASGIRWRDGCVEWNGLSLKAMFDRKDKYGVEAQALGCETAYVRIIHRRIKGRRRWHVQLVQKGLSFWKDKNPVCNGVAGLDIGPSSLAAVGDESASLVKFCPEVDSPLRQMRVLQRAMDRSRRSSNPQNYNPDRTVKHGVKHWVYSKGYVALRQELCEIHRRMSATRKTAHGRMANRIIAMGTHVRSETLSYKALQKRWGKSVNERAPSMFMSILRRKAERTGGEVMDLATWKLWLSQICHGCGQLRKKKLSERWHQCECGVGPVQRDLYSAFLAKHSYDETLSIPHAEQAWASAESLLRRVMERLDQTARGKLRLASFGLPRRQSGSHVKDGSAPGKVTDVVRTRKRASESREELVGLAVRTPCL